MPQNKNKRGAHLGEGNGLPGFPGYRTREGRTGYDPLDSNQEEAFMEGTFYRNLFTLRLRTRNVFYLSLMFIFGVILFIPLIFALAIAISQFVHSLELYELISILMVTWFVILAGLLTINFLMNILEIARIIPPLQRGIPRPVKERRKRLPKHRKDYQ